jgi:16S rRNA (uracil1498-N3)-methyltransferase
MTPRLYVTDILSTGSRLHLEGAPLHYLKNVLRLPQGAVVNLFNGRDGEYQSQIETYSKKSMTLLCETQLREQQTQLPLTLMCALIKHTRLEFLVEKATELGVSDIQPLVCDRCSYRKINVDRLGMHAIEATEQSERLNVPDLKQLKSLREAILNFSGDILWADESRDQTLNIFETLNKISISAVLIGPEGGFSDLEKEFLRSQPKVHPVHMGSLILRAETAGIALISAYQAQSGAWR